MVRTIRLLGAVLDHVGSSPTKSSIRSMAEDIGADKSSIHRLLRDLEEEKLLTRDPISGGYVFGPRLLGLARRQEMRWVMNPMVGSTLDTLRDQTGETAGLFIRVGVARYLVVQRESLQILRVSLDMNRTLPLHAGAAGRILMSAMPDYAIAEYMRSPSHIDSSIPIPDSAELEKELSDVRHRGYATGANETSKGVASLAVPVLDNDKNTVAALALMLPTSRESPETLTSLLPYMHETAEQLAKCIDEPGGNL